MTRDPDRTHSRPADPPTGTFEGALEGGLAVAFGPDATPGGWSRPPLLRDDPSDFAPVVQPSSAEMPRGSADRYQLLGEIARGGMGVVLKGRDPDLGRDLAFKVLRADLAGKPAAVQRFMEEAQVGGQLQHPGVVPVYDLGRFADGRPYFAMKLVKGRTLADLLAERPTPAADRGRFLQHFLQVCQTLAYAHARGVIHRDVKPSNVMVGAFGEVLVMDWGLAKVLPRGGVADELKATQAGRERERPEPVEPTVIQTARAGSLGSDTLAGSVMGTPAFMPPEQAGGEVDKLDERADVFGLGAVLCVILTGQPPYVAATSDAVRLMAVRGDLEEAFARLDGCRADAELVGLAKRCLAAKREARPRHAGEVVDAVAGHLAGVEDRARRAEVERAAADARTAEERKRRRVQLALAASVLALVAGAGSGGWYVQKQVANRERAEAERVRQDEDARRVAAVRAERERLGVEQALAQLPGLYDRGLWDQADGALAKTATFLGPDADPELRARVERAKATAAFLRRLDQVRLERLDRTEGRGDPLTATVKRYAVAFREAGFDSAAADVGSLARWVTESGVREYLLAALDDWRLFERDEELAGRLTAVTVAVTGEEWRATLREAWDDGARLAAVYDAIPAEQLTPAVIASVGERLSELGQDGARRLEAGLRRYPSDFWLHWSLGNMHHFTPAKAASCVGAFRAALAVRPKSAQTLNHLAVALKRTKDLDGAIAAHREAISLEPLEPRLHSNLAAALNEKGDHDGAIAACKEAIRLDGTLESAYGNLGDALNRKGEHAGAEQAYREAIRFGSGDPAWSRASFHSRLGLTLAQQRKYDDAIASYREAIRLDPKKSATHHNLGVTLRKKGDYHGAVASYREAVRLDPKDTRSQVHLGIALWATGDQDGALAAYQEAVRIDPAYAFAWKMLGDGLKYHKKDLAGALPAYREAVRLNPKDADAHLRLGHTLAESGRPAEALRVTAEALVANPGWAGDPRTFFRYNAACFAMNCADGKGSDAPPPAERPAYRKQALDHLTADLAATRTLLAADLDGNRDFVHQRMLHWFQDADLASVRDRAGLDRLPLDEAVLWATLWAEVQDLRGATVPPEKGPPPREVRP